MKENLSTHKYFPITDRNCSKPNMVNLIIHQHINIKLLFANNTFKAICEMVEMVKTRTIPYHPISNG